MSNIIVQERPLAQNRRHIHAASKWALERKAVKEIDKKAELIKKGHYSRLAKEQQPRLTQQQDGDSGNGRPDVHAKKKCGPMKQIQAPDAPHLGKDMVLVAQGGMVGSPLAKKPGVRKFGGTCDGKDMNTTRGMR